MDSPEQHDEDLERRRARRRARSQELRRRRRRRLLAIGGLLLVAVVLAVILTNSGGSDGQPPAGSHQGGRGAHSRGGGASGARGEARTPGRRSATPMPATGRPGTEPVPILMYHVINQPPPGAPFPGLYVPPGEFSEQMQALAHAGFHAVTMDQMLAYWRHGTPLPRGKPIVLSFDNGYQSQYTQALPLLRGLGWVGVENLQLTGLPPSQGGLSRAQVRGLVAAGWELDTQGFSHADLITLEPSELHYQVAVARRVTQERFGAPVNWFCYPSGHYNDSVVAAVEGAGYVGSTTVVPGWARPGEDPYRLPRLRVLGGTGGQTLLSEIAAIRTNAAPPSSYGSS